jgi:hypothetical protein
VNLEVAKRILTSTEGLIPPIHFEQPESADLALAKRLIILSA